MYKDKSPDREWRWRLRAVNGRIVAGSGEGYASKANCENGIQLVKKSANAPVEVLEDE